LLLVGLLIVGVAACGDGPRAADQVPDSGQPGDEALTAFQVQHGIGPVTEAVALGDQNPDLAAQGAQVFETKCSACHKLGERYVGPALGDVLDRRTPAFVMNMMLNPQEMYERHPEMKALLAEYMSYMPNQNLSRDDARAVVEYLRQGATP
jgi:mono/diheme cytochrome c family protein